MAKEISEKDFNQLVVESKGVVLVDFWADWCGPCQAMIPILESASKKLEGKAQVFKLNVDQNQEIASRFGVMSIPTLIFFTDGKEIDRKIGLQSEEGLIGTVESLLNK